MQAAGAASAATGTGFSTAPVNPVTVAARSSGAMMLAAEVCIGACGARPKVKLALARLSSHFG
jgi:hypothetical protein